MMSLIDLDDDQRWVPTHVNVTVLRARELRTKGKHGSRYLYTIIQVGKEKYTTGLVEKAAMPEWNEECCFELLPGILEAGGRGDYPPGSGDLVLTVMHRVLIGLDVFLGQAIVPLDKIFDDGMCPRDEWLKLHSRVGRKEKERGDLQTTVQFTRNNMTASMFDLTLKDKPRSAFGKLKDRVTGRKRGDVESSSAIVPGRFAALSGSLGQPFGEGGGGRGGGGEEITRDVQQAPEEKRSKMKDFFKGKLRRSDDTRSCSSLASESSMSSVASENPPPSLDLLADPPSSPIYSPKVKVDSHYGETDLAKKVLTTQHTTKVLTHKRAFSDEASRITTAAGIPRPHPAMESIMGLTQSKSSLCINGSHIYDSEPSTPFKSGGGGASKLVLLEKCSPLSRSLQNLTKRGGGGGGGGEDKGSSPGSGEGRRWSFDKGKKEDKEEGTMTSSSLSAAASQVQSARIGACPAQPGQAVPSSAVAVSPPDKGKKMRKTLFSTGGGRSDSLPAKSEHGQAGSWAPEGGRLRGWFGSGDSQNKPRLEGSPKVESSSDALPPPLPPRSPIHHPEPSSPPVSPTHIPPESHGSHRANNNPFTPSPSPSPTPPISPSNPFLPRMQRNPFFVELIAEESRRSPPLVSSGSPLPHCTALPSSSSASRPCIPMPAPPSSGPAPRVDAATPPKRVPSIRRERPRAVARQVSLPAMLPRPVTPGSLGHFTPRSMSDSGGEQWDDSFDAFASSRLNAPTGALHHQMPLRAQRRGKPPDDGGDVEGLDPPPPPLPPRRPLRSASSELYSNSWLHRGQELAVQKEACLLSQTGAASRQRAREEEQQRRRNNPSSTSPSPDPPTASETSESLGGRSQPSEAGLNSSSGLPSDSDKLKKFKYEPLEDDVHCWKGMLFEQDLYGRIGSTGSYGEPRVNDALLSAAPEEPAGNQIASKSTAPSQKADITGPKMLLNSELTVADLLSMSADATAPKSNSKALSVAPVTLEPVVYSPPQQPTSANNNISYSLTLEDLNMNVSNSLDFSFIDSEGSSPSETTADTLRGLKDLGESFPQPPEDLHVAVYHEGTVVTPEDMFALKNATSEMNSSLVDMSVSPDKMWPVSPVSEEDTSENLFSSSDLETEPRPVRLKGEEEFRQTDATFDGNGNAEVKLQTASHQIGSSSSSSFSGVLSARLRPKGATQEVHDGVDGSPCSRSKKENDKCNGLSHPVRRISETGEGPFSYQPANSSHSSSLTLDKESSCLADNNTSVISSLETLQSIPNKTGKTENSLSGQTAAGAFEDLHARVAPNVSPSKSKIGQSLQDPAPPPPPPPSSVSIPSAAAALLSLSSDSINAPPPPANRHPHPAVPPGLHPLTTRPSADTSTTTTTTTTTTTLALALVRAALLSSSSSSSYSSSTAQSLVDARHTLLPEETQPAISCYLPLQESSPHPVKPLTSTTTQPEKKEGRSVLEKLKSTIHPGRAAQQSAATEADKAQEAAATAVDHSAQYQSLTNMELISLLLQQEMDMQKQQASSEEQAALLSKRDAELRKVKTQVRDLEDYIDNLLLRIMEQTPTLLQVRGIARHK